MLSPFAVSVVVAGGLVADFANDALAKHGAPELWLDFGIEIVQELLLQIMNETRRGNVDQMAWRVNVGLLERYFLFQVYSCRGCLCRTAVGWVDETEME